MSKLIQTNLNMIFTTKKYYTTLAGTIITAIISILFVKFMEGQYQLLTPEFIALLKNSDYLNLYVIRVKDIEDILNLTGADMLYLCFSGCFLPGVIAVFTITWITYGYKTGMTRFLVARGCKRYQIVLSNYISLSVSILGIMFTYLAISFIGGILLGGIGEIDGIDFLIFLVEQSAIHIIFGILCAAVAYVVENEAFGIVCMISLIIAIPDFMKYLKIFTNSTKDYDLLWILSYSSKLALHEACPMGLCAVLLGVILGLAVFISVSVFGTKEVR